MSTRQQPGRRVRFGPFLFDPDSGELWRGDDPVKLQPQPAKLLALLIDQAGRVVSREEIQERLWGDAAVDAESGVNFAVRRVRKALGETADENRFIETLPKLGYRFIAHIETLSSTPEAGAPSRRTWITLAAGAVLALAIAVRLSSAPSGHDHVETPGTVPAARDAFLQGMYLLDKQTEAAKMRAGGFFRRAIVADPNYAPAYVQLEVAERDLLTFEEREQLLRQALEKDGQLATAYMGLGWLEMAQVDPGAAAESFEWALRLDPTLVEAQHGSALAHGSLGEFEPALQRLESALEVDPGATLIRGDAFLIYFWAERPMQALAQLEEALRLEPDDRGLRWAATSYLTMAERWHDAAKSIKGYPPPDFETPPAPEPGGEAFWRWQVEVYYSYAVEQMLSPDRESPAAGGLAEALLALGRYDEALDWLEESVGENWYGLPYLGVDPRWDAVRDDSRFQALLVRLGLEDQR